MAITLDDAGGEGAARGRGVAQRAWAGRDAWAPTLAAVALAASCVLLALQGAFNHDEEQYVAAAALARTLRPVLDFPYLQSPLQPWLFAPLFDPANGRLFAVARLVSAALTLAALACGYGIVRRGGGSPALAALATVAVAASACVQTMTLTGRNDALPCALMAAGVLCLLMRDAASARRPAAWAGGAGLLLALSFSAKLTYLFAPAGGGLWLLWACARGRAGGREVAAFGLGAALGLAPILATFAAAPGAAWFDMVGFHRDVTPAWYARNGLGERRDLLFHLAFWVAVPLREPPTLAAFAALLAGGFGAASGRLRLAPAAAGACALLVLFAALAAVAASLPNPSFTAYAAPPAFLTVLAAAVLVAGLPPGRVKAAAVALGALAAAWGWAPAVLGVARAGDPADWTTARIHATSLAAREAVAAAGLHGPIATLSPIRALDAGSAVYPEFAPGPFLFRSGDDVAPAAAARIGGATPQGLDALFARRPPAAILTGYERGDFRIDADAPLDAWARAHGWPQTRTPDGGRLYLAPRGGG